MYDEGKWCILLNLTNILLFYLQHELFDQYRREQSEDLQRQLFDAALLIPNKSSPDTVCNGLLNSTLEKDIGLMEVNKSKPPNFTMIQSSYDFDKYC